jgi:integrase
MRHIPYQANRTLGVLSKMFNLAEVWGLRPDGSNPCRHVKKYPEEKRERFLDAEELARLGQALREIEAEDSETASVIAAIRLLTLTGCRLTEILTLKWEYIEGETIHLPNSKTGRRAVYLGTAAREVLNGIEKQPDNPYVITGKKPGSHLTDLQHPWQRVRKRAGLEDVRIHDLRHSFASSAVTLGEGLPMIGKLLGHTQVQTTARYAHLAADPVKSAAERVSETLASAMASARVLSLSADK